MAAARSSLFLWFAVLCSPLGVANVAVEHPLRERLDEADVVVVATAVSISKVDGYNAWATLGVDFILKGHPGPTIRLRLDSPIAEFSPDCCVVGARYLLLLTLVKDGTYVSVSGPNGVYLLNRALSPSR